MSKPVLYSYWRSSCSWRVRIALSLKGIDYEYKDVHLVKEGGQQYADDFKKMNPMSQVPCLIIDDTPLYQSLPIIEYLDETRPGVNLLPKDPVKRQKSRALSEIINAGIQPIQNLKVLQEISEDKAVWAKRWIERGFDGLELSLQDTAGKFCVGEEVSMADLCLVPQVFNAKRFAVDMEKYPIISRINAELEQIDAFKAADAYNQPDTPEAERK